MRNNKEFIQKAETVYQEITQILRKHNMRMDWDEGQGIVLEDKKTGDYVAVTSDLGHFERWE